MNIRPLRCLRAMAAAVLTVLLAACGPGVGGSGTGQTTDTLPPALSAMPAFVCAGDLAPALACDPAAGAGTDALTRGTAPVGFAAVVDGQAVLVRVDGNRIGFSVGCTALRFAGSWGMASGQEPRFQGLIDPSGNATPATLAAQRDGTSLWLTLRAADGTVLYGPVRVAPAAGATPCV